MAGHSKWANIKHRKGANDVKKGKVFGKMIKEILAAAKQGNTTPELNPRLRIAIQNAKSANVPKQNIERALKKSTQKDAQQYAEVVYEGYAAHGVGVIVVCMTDNTNRAVAAVRAAFAKHGGSLCKTNDLAFLFDKNGMFTLSKASVSSEEALSEAMIQAEASDIDFRDGRYQIVCPIECFGNVQKALEEDLRIDIQSAGIIYVPRHTVALQSSKAALLYDFVEVLEEQEDVHQVFHNLSQFGPL